MGFVKKDNDRAPVIQSCVYTEIHIILTLTSLWLKAACFELCENLLSQCYFLVFCDFQFIYFCKSRNHSRLFDNLPKMHSCILVSLCVAWSFDGWWLFPGIFWALYPAVCLLIFFTFTVKKKCFHANFLFVQTDELKIQPEHWFGLFFLQTYFKNWIWIWVFVNDMKMIFATTSCFFFFL